MFDWRIYVYISYALWTCIGWLLGQMGGWHLIGIFDLNGSDIILAFCMGRTGLFIDNFSPRKGAG